MAKAGRGDAGEGLAKLLAQAAALGQNAEVLEAIAAGKVHPVMAAFGLWAGEEELQGLADEIAANREGQPQRPARAA
jgi:hypothetical protein